MPKREAASEWLTNHLAAQGQAKVPDIKAAARVEDIAWRTMRRAADELGVIKQPHGHGPRSYTTWELPPDHPAVS